MSYCEKKNFKMYLEERKALYPDQIHITEAYLRPCQISMMEPFCVNRRRLKAVKRFCAKKLHHRHLIGFQIHLCKRVFKKTHHGSNILLLAFLEDVLILYSRGGTR